MPNMFLVKKIIGKLKTHLKARVFNRWIFIGCLLALVTWAAWDCCDADGPRAAPKRLHKYVSNPEGYRIPDVLMNDMELEELTRKIEKSNRNPIVRNVDKFGPVAANTTVVAVQVQRGAAPLRRLVAALARARHIHQALLVFSHSCFDDTMNEFIQSIRFCRVMQIFFPYSMQLHPDSFPGMDPGDGFNRDARRSEHKQHWWWKAHFVFNLNGSAPSRAVVFLEENDYVLPDFLYMLRYLRHVQRYFSPAEVMSLGRADAEGLDYDTILLDSWSPKYDRGLVFNSSTWGRIAANATRFCRYNDWGWSRSLAHVFAAWGAGGVDVVSCLAPRALRQADEAAEAAQAAAEARAGGAGVTDEAGSDRWAALFPRTLRAVVLVVGAGGRVRPAAAAARARGGWADRRDRRLCLDIIRPDRQQIRKY